MQRYDPTPTGGMRPCQGGDFVKYSDVEYPSADTSQADEIKRVVRKLTTEYSENNRLLQKFTEQLSAVTHEEDRYDQRGAKHLASQINTLRWRQKGLRKDLKRLSVRLKESIDAINKAIA